MPFGGHVHGDPCDELLSPGQRVAQDGSVSLELGRGTQHREVAGDTQHDGWPGEVCSEFKVKFTFP